MNFVSGCEAGGRFGMLEDVVGAVIFLPSRAATYVMDVEVALDGGLTGSACRYWVP